MDITRRDTLVSGSAALLALGFAPHLRADEITAEAAIVAFSRGAAVEAGSLSLHLDAVAEDGFKVPIEVVAPGAEAIVILAPENPVPTIALVQFGALAAQHRLNTRIRLARSQEVIALARMPDGKVYRTSRHVDVIVGGCGA